MLVCDINLLSSPLAPVLNVVVCLWLVTSPAPTNIPRSVVRKVVPYRVVV